MRLRVKVKKVNEAAELPKYAREFDAGFDLVAVENVVIEPGETKVIPTGLAFEIPPGYEMTVRPRSGISRKTTLHVALGTIDSGFRGEVGVIMKNLKAPILYIPQGEDELYQLNCNLLHDINGEGVQFCDQLPKGSYYIRKGERIAQGIIAPVETACFVETDELSESERGAGGFGSTGVK
ncbi:deoxyuridine 5'-triphosphate nucleotidohydrolase [Bacillus pseudomycoides]|uniref:dUTP diphosphatase n=1 Tax=Bacillus pseudomycoides TaxID=64104 RepID=A0AA91ZVE5_9BACI|nr:MULTISPECIES: deoxyuridine 5'-triphosphate nucleotidohydrolase [Bacillus]PED84327.1 deoxyuridine 5'-triphosphate nucleotidohydrolase [Bacillus pseudomycoides]PEU08684.1 deoxyuridine 5'-triphosphate nucleotidohydrolase [Bacillus sp. AFS014408]PEU15854.1 deoxyuridine 5'-triphosphate nucleotidohydrolase [Bacillus sp. AFS019443]PFW64846.1 deoxyuridine 5'-triphosphate nucleotidohydrolase [Bacillus sp. AFS075034]